MRVGAGCKHGQSSKICGSARDAKKDSILWTTTSGSRVEQGCRCIECVGVGHPKCTCELSGGIGHCKRGALMERGYARRR